MSTNTFPKSTAPTHFFIFVFTASTVAWSFHFTSFNHAKELVLFLGAILAGYFLLGPQTNRISFHTVWRFLGVIILYNLLQPFLTGISYTPESILSWGRFYFLIGFVALICLTLKKEQIYELLIQTIILSSVVVSLLALGQKFGLLLALFPVVEGYTQPIYSVFGNQNLLGGYMAVGLPVLLFKYIQNPAKRQYAALFLLLLTTLILSESRTAWLASAAGIGTVFYDNHKNTAKKTYLILGSVGALCILIPIFSGSVYQKIIHTGTAEDVSFGLRQWIWTGSFGMWKSFALSGTGLGNFAYQSPIYLGQILDHEAPNRFLFNEIHTWHAHSDYLETLINFGVLGFFIIAIAFWALIRSSSELKPAFITLAVFSVFNTTLHCPPFAVLWLLLIFHSFAEDTAPRKSSPMDYGVYIVTAVFGTFIVYSSIFPSYLLDQARDSYEMGEERVIVSNRYETASAFWSAPPETYLEWAVLEIEEKNFNSSLDILVHVNHRMDTGEWHYAMGICHQEIGNQTQAIEHYRESIKRWPRFRPAWERLIPLVPDEEKLDLERQLDAWMKHSNE
jgi:O-antigen ligase